MAIKRIKKNDAGVVLRFVIKNQDNAVVDLDGATVTVVISGGNTATRLSKTCTVDSAPNGTCHYTLVAADTTVAGKYLIEVLVYYSTTNTQTTYDQGELEIMEVL